MGLFSKKCFACGMKIEGEPVKLAVPVRGYVGEHQKDFCCNHCAEGYLENFKTGKGSASCH